MIKCILRSLAAEEYILDTKALPGQIIFVAWWRVPTSDNICLFVAFFLGSHVVKSWFILVTLSVGSLISMYLVSNIIPKKDNDVVRPSNFSVASGTPSSAHKDRKCQDFAGALQILVDPLSNNHLNKCKEKLVILQAIGTIVKKVRKQGLHLQIF